MPISIKERNTGDISVSVSTTLPADDTATITIQETTGAFTIASGKLKVEILNMGFVEDPDLEVSATVNAQSLQPGTPPLIFEAATDPVNNLFKRTPAITGNGNGARIRITTTA